MADNKDKDKKVIGIRKDVVIQGKEENEPPIEALVKLTKVLYEDALSGNMREFAYAACNNDEDFISFGMAGQLGYNYTLMSTKLRTLSLQYDMNISLPALTGIYFDEDLDVDE